MAEGYKKKEHVRVRIDLCTTFQLTLRVHANRRKGEREKQYICTAGELQRRWTNGQTVQLQTLLLFLLVICALIL